VKATVLTDSDSARAEGLNDEETAKADTMASVIPALSARLATSVLSAPRDEFLKRRTTLWIRFRR
jgi:hypothetical protein